MTPCALGRTGCLRAAGTVRMSGLRGGGGGGQRRATGRSLRGCAQRLSLIRRLAPNARVLPRMGELVRQAAAQIGWLATIGRRTDGRGLHITAVSPDGSVAGVGKMVTGACWLRTIWRTCSALRAARARCGCGG